MATPMKKGAERSYFTLLWHQLKLTVLSGFCCYNLSQKLSNLDLTLG